ncbi:transmembrane protein 218 [Nothobranchius furzeri]|uniref:Transmembrane protein 218 n=1 Tax=Nothobranchius furzeri TaxID=105023 RepID=A0A8C6LAN5_NOTFU|nr:transmembrane protein 218 [Nothobranchius furzeri]KAF7205272.1 transmembrane protein 218 [Nothobranchius furzeri]
MTDAILQVGPGVFIIAVVWIAALGFGIILLRAAGSAKLGVIPVFSLALTITLALVFFPRHPENPPSFRVIEIVDTFFIGRYILLAVAGLVFLVAFFMMLPFYLLEPVSVKAMRTF